LLVFPFVFTAFPVVMHGVDDKHDFCNDVFFKLFNFLFRAPSKKITRHAKEIFLSHIAMNNLKTGQTPTWYKELVTKCQDSWSYENKRATYSHLVNYPRTWPFEAWGSSISLVLVCLYKQVMAYHRSMRVKH